ncbi:MAG: hypothetical protein KBA26_08085 [Candidatus Delongbacteria bacterium]|nr:hypothetical protein [Candidatus Delongbacteria bacterium]
MVIESFWSRIIPAGILGLILLTACSLMQSGNDWHKPVARQMQNGQVDQAVAAIETAYRNGRYASKDRFLYYLDAGLAYHYATQPDSSNRRLHLAEQTAEDLYTKSVSRTALSWLWNDNVTEYAGEDYEVLYTNLFKALNFAAQGQWESGMVEIRRADLKLELLEQKYADLAAGMNRNQDSNNRIPVTYQAERVNFHNDALARYLSMHFYAASGDPDNARVDYDKLVRAFEDQPAIYSFPVPAVNYQPAPGQAILSVVAMTGLSPVKEKFELRVRGDKTLDLIQVLYTDTQNQDAVYHQIPLRLDQDFYAKLSIPRVVERPGRIAAIRIYTGTQLLGQLQLLENTYSVALETFKAKQSLIYLRTVVRVVGKLLGGNRLKQEVDNPHFDGWLKKLLVDVYTDWSESADIRCSRLLPGKIWVGDFELPPGDYPVRLEFLDEGGYPVSVQTIPSSRVSAGRMNLVEASCFQ